MANRGLAKFWDGVNCGKMRIIKHYIEHGASVNIKDGGGRTPLHYAAISGYLEVAKYLVERGAEVDMQNEIGLTPLFYAARYDHLDMCRYLLETAKASIYIEDRDGRTALHLAARFGHPTVCRYLLSRGADPDSCDNRGHRPDEGENFFSNVDEIDRSEIYLALSEARTQERQKLDKFKSNIVGYAHDKSSLHDKMDRHSSDIFDSNEEDYGDSIEVTDNRFDSVLTSVD